MIYTNTLELRVLISCHVTCIKEVETYIQGLNTLATPVRFYFQGTCLEGFAFRLLTSLNNLGQALKDIRLKCDFNNVFIMDGVELHLSNEYLSLPSSTNCMGTITKFNESTDLGKECIYFIPSKKRYTLNP